MTGARRSNGCARCVQRRVKCDERLPGCIKCEKYGQPCPGYDRGFKFVAGKPYRSQRRPKLEESIPAGQNVSDTACISLMQGATPLSFTSADLNVMQSLELLIDESSYPFPAASAHVISRWFRQLPSIYGRSRTLDSTIRSFAAHHIGRVTQNEQIVRYARSVYVEALSRLRVSLGRPAECFSSDVFCAVLLLCLYELFANDHDKSSWMKHANGLSQLTRIRGARRFDNEFDRTLLKASRLLIVMHSLFSGQECFLASEEWLSVMRQHFSSGNLTDTDHMTEEFFAYFTYAPKILQKWYNFKHASPIDPSATSRIQRLLAEALDMRDKLLAWYDIFSKIAPPPIEIPSLQDDALFPTIYWFCDINTATFFCGYYSYMALIHEVLRTCGFPGEHSVMIVYFRDQICKSVEYTARGILGPYRMGFPLMAAYELADPATRSWLEEWMKRLSKRYAALQPKNFG